MNKPNIRVINARFNECLHSITAIKNLQCQNDVKEEAIGYISKAIDFIVQACIVEYGYNLLVTMKSESTIELTLQNYFRTITDYSMVAKIEAIEGNGKPLYDWIPIENLPVTERKYSQKIFVCDCTNESKEGDNYPQVVMWDGVKWLTTWRHEEYTKKITHYLPVYLTDGKLST